MLVLLSAHFSYVFSLESQRQWCCFCVWGIFWSVEIYEYIPGCYWTFL